MGVLKYNDVNCKSHDHLNQIDTLCSQLCSVLKQASDDSIPTSKIHTHHDYIVPGFNEFAKQLHSEARRDYLLWKASGKLRSGLLYLNMCQSRIRFKRTLRECRQNEEIIHANAHVNFLMEKDSSKAFVERELHSIKDSSIVFRPIDICNALKNAKTGKACRVDGPAAEHFIYADAIIHVHLSLLFNCFISHGY